MGQLTKVGKQFPKHVLQVVYEASYIGFTLQRDLTDKGIYCEVVAPSNIPRQGGNSVKTDRIDAAQPGCLKANLEIQYRQLQDINRSLAEYNQQIEALAQTERYQKPVQALTCYKGIKTIFALTMITEIGDIQRFPHSRQLVSWIGMDIREYSSGRKHNWFGITNHGKRYLRTAFIEANQRGYRTTRLSKGVRLRQAHSAPEYVEVATRCLRRLSKKGNRLLLAGKHPNKVKVACAREMVGSPALRQEGSKSSVLCVIVPVVRHTSARDLLRPP